ncbi:MAG TPA: phage regulatory CII family protein [Verrucomicrobiae bacterium]|nr:phage regulatory CII family protein [Verrucomicrobiae bacterium]
MKSYELLREVFQAHNPKEIADKMGLSVSMVYKWAEPPEQGSGATNPLDRTVALMEAAEDARIVEWICAHANGFFIENPKVTRHRTYSLVPATHRVVQDFAEMLSVIANGAVDDNISQSEAERIRMRWEDLKSVTESFVRACEEGSFHKIRNHERR